MKSIQTKFIALILGCILLCSAVIGGAGILSSKKVVDQDSAQILNQLCEQKTEEMDALLSRIEQSVKTLSVYSLENLESVDKLKTDSAYMEEYTEQLESIAVNAANNTEGALAVYVRFNPEFAPPTSGLFWSKTDLDGSFKQLTPTDFSSYSPSDAEHVGWYYIPVKSGKSTWMSPYMNQNINKQMISYVIPVYSGNETVGVVGMDIDFGIIEEMVGKIKAYESGYAFLTDSKGTVLCHHKLTMGTLMENVDGSLAPVVDELANESSGSNLFSYHWEGQEKRMAFRTLRNGMQLAITVPAGEIDAKKNNLIMVIFIAVLLIASLSVLVTVCFTRKIVRPLKELNEAAKKIVEGDLSISLTQTTKDEVGALADSFQQTVDHLQKYISYINGLAYRDALTGVKNKTAYQDAEQRMEDQMRLGRPEFAVVVMDINNLKFVNDNYGHDFGDMLIIDACKIICKVFRHSPVYRIGGDEFVIILENSDYKDYQKLLEEFQDAMDEYNRSGHPYSNLSIARGIAIYSSETDLVFANVFKRADDSMYQNKAAMKRQSED